MLENFSSIGNSNSVQFNSILYFNVLTQQLQEPITESAQEKKINIKIENNKQQVKTKQNKIFVHIIDLNSLSYREMSLKETLLPKVSKNLHVLCSNNAPSLRPMS
jgi:hypothetical protein